MCSGVTLQARVTSAWRRSSSRRRRRRTSARVRWFIILNVAPPAHLSNTPSSLDSPDPHSFSRNKRGIAGTLVWINFDRHALLNVVRLNAGQFVANVDDIRPQYSPANSAYIGQTAVFTSSLITDSSLPLGADISQIDATQQLTAVNGLKELARVGFSIDAVPVPIFDLLPPRTTGHASILLPASVLAATAAVLDGSGKDPS